ncbi:hypothetical protein D8T36_19780 [Vibrio vulnificus]|uniref:hypothetical protein n=1 Tax=Vibrio vulnificus TaxID=672 RepID=UPI001022FA63|nr:hypothetical protein [Vibrio vulnificus]RZQ21808.1 hypothetical protein D8T36_19780 [Vibrio vulnificus]
MASYTVTTPISAIPTLKGKFVKLLSNHNISTLGDINNVGFLILAANLEKPDIDQLYEVVYKANVSFHFEKTDLIENLPKISKRNTKKLKELGYTQLIDFNDVYFPDIYELIGFGPAKELLVMIRSASINVRFEDPGWSENEWKDFTYQLVELGLVTWEDIAICVCSELNPPQVGTAVANQVKNKYPSRQAMKHVFEWFYSQSGKCEISGKRLWLEADHIESKEEFIRSGRDVDEANTLENFQLLTKRENVIKRGSHRLGGLSFAQASAVLVYILLRYRPKNIIEYSNLCRNYGLTMASIRFQEAWALAEWLAKEDLYKIE